MEHDVIFEKRMRELAARAWQRDLVLFSDFLDLNELNILHMISGREYGVRILTSGGFENAERQMAAFVPEALFSCQENPFSGPENRSRQVKSPSGPENTVLPEADPVFMNPLSRGISSKPRSIPSSRKTSALRRM